VLIIDVSSQLHSTIGRPVLSL